MAIVGWILSSIFSLWPVVAGIIIIVLSTMLLFKKRQHRNWDGVAVPDSWADGLAEIKPGKISGNDILESGGFTKQYEDIYKAMKGLRYCLYYNGGTWFNGKKRFFVMDPELVTKIMVTDFDHFANNEFFSPDYMKTMGNVFGIADAQGDHWKKLRKAVNGPFSLPRMKNFMPFFTKAGKEMVQFIEKESIKGNKFDASDILKRSVINTLGAVGFGMDAKAFETEDCELRKNGDLLMQMWRFILVIMIPSIATFFRISVYNPKAEAWFTALMKKHIKNRKSQNEIGTDILSTLIKVHEENPEELDENSLVRTTLQYIFDGYNSTSEQLVGALAFIVTHPDVMTKLTEEIDAVFDAKEDGDIDLTDTDIVGMKYLDCVLSEVTRLAVVSVSSRCVTKPWKVPGTDLTLPVGVSVYVPISALHKDPEYWENPLEFDPERFNAENKSKIKSGTYLPFGLGLRQCLGQNYAKFTMKMNLIYILRFFDVENCENMPKNFELDPDIIMSPKGGLRVKFHKRQL